MMHEQKVNMCTVEANSIEEGLLNMYLAFEAAEGVGSTNTVSACPACTLLIMSWKVNLLLLLVLLFLPYSLSSSSSSSLLFFLL